MMAKKINNNFLLAKETTRPEPGTGGGGTGGGSGGGTGGIYKFLQLSKDKAEVVAEYTMKVVVAEYTRVGGMWRKTISHTYNPNIIPA